MRPENPAAQGAEANNADRDNGIVERLGIDRVRSREAENDRDEADVTAAHESYWAREDA